MEVKSAGCPLGAKCEEVRETNGEQVMFRCDWYINVRGKHPQSEEEIDKWGCAIAWMPMLTIENTQQTRQAGAAIESLRNEMVKGQNNFLNLLQSRKRQIELANIDHHKQ